MNVPVLPPEKDFHIFVCYCSANREQVEIIIRNLETKGYKCCYHDRDFTAGECVMGNMHDSIEKSMHMLVILSEDFNDSVYCSHEVNQAMHARITQKYSIIPLKIEPCTVPKTLRNLTYIDGEEKDPNTLHNDIIRTIEKRECCQDQSVNGSKRSFGFSRTRPWPGFCALSRYNFCISETERSDLATAEFGVSEDVLDKIEHIVNRSYLVQNLHILNNFSRLTTLLCLILLSIYSVIIIAMCLTLLGNAPQDRETNQRIVLGVGLTLPCVIIVGYCVLLSMELCYGGGGGRITSYIWGQAKAQLNKDLWVINKHAETTRYIVLFTYTDLDIIRFDMAPCKRMFRHRCNQKELLKCRQLEDESVEVYTDRLFEEYMNSEKIHNLNRACEGYTNRHKMKNKAKCLCLLVELSLEAYRKVQN